MAADGEGAYYFQTVASDNVANVEAGPSGNGDSSTLLDTVDPESSSSSPTSFVSGSVDFTAQDGDGTYYFQTVAIDGVGNMEAGPSGGGDCSTIVDTIAPVSSCSSPTSSSSTEITVTYEASDVGTGVTDVELWYKFGEAGTWTDTGLADGAGTFDFTAADGDGTYYFQTVAIDGVGNVEAGASGDGDSSTLVDTTAPESYATAPSQVAEAPFDVQFAASDASSGVAQTQLHYRFNGGTWQDYGDPEAGASGSFDFSAPDGEGTYDFYTVSTDNAGNVEVAPSEPDATTMYSVVAGELSMSISADGTDYAFDDVVEVTVEAANDGTTVQADIYVALAYSFGGESERFWSPVGFEAWTEGIVPWLTNFELPNGLDVSVPVWSLPVPNDVPNLALTGDYTLLIAATEPGTFEFICDIAAWGFSIQGSPFISLNADAEFYGLGDTLSIGVAVSAPDYDLLGDVYLIVLDPDGAFWSPVGESWAWTSRLEAFMPAFNLPASLELTLDGLWQIPLTGEAPPFNGYGDYYLMAGITEGGALTLWCDIGVDSLTIE